MTVEQLAKRGFWLARKKAYRVQKVATGHVVYLNRELNAGGKNFYQFESSDGCVLLVPDTVLTFGEAKP